MPDLPVPAGPVTVGIDIGTTSVKAVAADADGRVLAPTRVAHEVRSPAPGRLEHDINHAWRRNVRRAWRDVAHGHDVRAVQVSAMVPSLGAVSRRGTAAGPGILYGDTRSGVDAGRNPAESGELLGFARWLARNHPDAHGYWPAQAVANHALCGMGAIDSTSAMTAVPLFDFVGWDEAIATELGTTPAAFPVVSPGADPIGFLPAELSAATSGSTPVLVGGGTIDALGEQWVAGADQPGDVLVICGASLITWIVVPEWVEIPGLWTVPHTAPGLTLVGGPSNAGGIFVDWARRLLAPPPRRLDGESLDPDRIPVWTPYPKGERTPLHDPGLRAGVHGLDLVHGPAALERSVFEAAAFVVRHHLDVAGVQARRIVATGGGTRSNLWMQCLSDATGVPVHVVAVPEGAALGAAFLARVTAGLEARAEDASRWARTGRVVDPDPVWRAPVEGRYEIFLDRTAALASPRSS